MKGIFLTLTFDLCLSSYNTALRGGILLSRQRITKPQISVDTLADLCLCCSHMT